MKNKKDRGSVWERRLRRELFVIGLLPGALTLTFLVLSLVKQELRITARLSPLIALPLLCYVPALHRWREKRRRESLGESEDRVPVLTRDSYVQAGYWNRINIGVGCLIAALAIFLPALDWILEEDEPGLWGPIGFFISLPLIAGICLICAARSRTRARRKLLRQDGLRILELPVVKKDSYTFRDSDGVESESYYIHFPQVFCRAKKEPGLLIFPVNYGEYLHVREGDRYYVLVDALHGDRELQRCYPKDSIRLGSDMLALMRTPEDLEAERQNWAWETEQAGQRRTLEEDRLRRMERTGGDALREYRKQYREEHREELRKKQLRRWGFVLAGILFTAAAPFILPLVFLLPYELGPLAALLLLAFLFAATISLGLLGGGWGLLWSLLVWVLSFGPLFLGYL